MSEILRQLQEEHVQLGRVLDLMAVELETFRAGDVPDYQLLEEIVDYCLDYPNACHHPKEDAIHAAMAAREPNLPKDLSDIIGSHEHLAQLTRRVHETVERVMRDETMSRDRFIDIVESFIDSYRAHIEAEEMRFLPAATRLLGDEDWTALNQRLDDREDPLLNAADERRFATLRSGILRTA